MNLQLGAGTKPIRGFVNIDLRDLPGTIRGHAHEIPAEDGTVDILFSNAVFEHLYLAQQIVSLREWERVLSPEGIAVAIGIPDFEAIARSYLERIPGTTRETFDLLEVYRYTHGFPEAYQDDPTEWKNWSPAEHPNEAPSGWLPQLHKTISDGESLAELVRVACRLKATVVRYCFPGEAIAMNLGLIVSHTAVDPIEALRRIPSVGAYIDFGTLAVV